MNPTNHIICDEKVCAGCRTCEAVCALSHEGVISPALARLEIISYPLEGWRIEVYTCNQCRAPECMYACPVEAISIDEKTDAKIIDQGKCIGCKNCIKACPKYPHAPIRFDPRENVCFKCDLCGGDPMCVKFCPESALKLSGKVI